MLPTKQMYLDYPALIKVPTKSLQNAADIKRYVVLPRVPRRKAQGSWRIHLWGRKLSLFPKRQQGCSTALLSRR